MKHAVDRELLRELAECCFHNGNASTSNKLQAILAEPERELWEIKQLEWESNGDFHYSGDYGITWYNGKKMFCVGYKCCIINEGKAWFDTLEAAQAAANLHNRERLKQDLKQV
jgi:hypothetical protein